LRDDAAEQFRPDTLMMSTEMCILRKTLIWLCCDHPQRVSFTTWFILNLNSLLIMQ